RLTLIPRSLKAVAIRSCVRGRPRGLPEILVAIAWASKEPIQMGRYRSASFSLRITRCWAVGIWIRMLSTETSMRFFIRDHITTSASQNRPSGPGNRPTVESERGERKARPGGPDRRPQPHLPGIFRAASDEHVGRRGDERR